MSRKGDSMEEQPSEIGGPAPPPKQSGSVFFYLLGGNITTRHWKKFIFLGVLLYVVVYSQSELWMEEAVYDEKYSQDLDDCWSGETTPGELGLTGMTCEELEQDFMMKLILSFGAACGCFCFGGLGLMGLANAALFFQGETSVELVAAQQERERLRAEMGEVHSNLVEAVRVHQEVLDSKQRAEADYRQAVEEHSELINAISQAQEGMSSELEAAAARAERNIEAARVAVEEAEKARADRSAAVRKFMAAEEELDRAVESIVESRSVAVNIEHKERIYQDSVHQEDESGED